MDKINFIVVKEYEGNKVELHVFTNDGEESTYCLSDGGIARTNGYTQLKNLAEQNGCTYTPKGLRNLIDKGLFYKMDEHEFDMTYEVMKQANKNQSNYQKEKKQEKQLPQKYKSISDFFTLEETSQKSIHTDNKNQVTVSGRDNLDSNRLHEFITYEEETLEEEREELAKDSEKKGIFHQFKRVVIAGIITAVIGAVGVVGVHFGAKKNKEGNDSTQNTKTIESTMTPLKVNTIAMELNTNTQEKEKNQTSSQETPQESTQQKEKKTSKNNEKKINKDSLEQVVESQNVKNKTRVKKQASNQENTQESAQQKEKKAIENSDTNTQEKEKNQTSNQETSQESKQQKEKNTNKNSDNQVAKSQNTNRKTGVAGTQYRTRMTSYWTGDGYESGTVTGSGLGVKNFQVNRNGWYTYHGKLVVGTATPYLLKYGYTLAKGVHTYRYYDELTLTIDGKDYPAIVLDSCGSSMKTDRIDLFVTDGKHAKDTYITVTKNNNSKSKQKVKTR